MKTKFNKQNHILIKIHHNFAQACQYFVENGVSRDDACKYFLKMFDCASDGFEDKNVMRLREQLDKMPMVKRAIEEMNLQP